jgi:hypothetical protein
MEGQFSAIPSVGKEHHPLTNKSADDRKGEIAPDRLKLFWNPHVAERALRLCKTIKEHRGWRGS